MLLALPIAAAHALGMAVTGGAGQRASDTRDTAGHPTVTRERSVELDIAQLYRRYGDMVLGRCRTLLRNEADAQDVCQEVFLKAHRYRDRFRGDASPSTWLYKITTTTCLNRLRTKKRQREDFSDEALVIPVEDTVLSGSEARDLVRRLLDLADERTQACIVYHYLDGMTHQEAGELLGISAAAVRKRLGVFRASLKNSPPAWLTEVEP